MSIEETYAQAVRQMLNMFGTGATHTLPMLLRRAGATRLAVLRYPSVIRAPEGKLVYPPRHALTFDLANGELVEAWTIEPRDLVPDAPPDVALGSAMMPAGMNAADWTAERSAMLRLYDAIEPSFSRDDPRPAREVREAAVELLRLFRRLAEPQMLPYCEAFAGDFFRWLRRIA